MKRWKKRTEKLMNILMSIEATVLLISGLAACGDLVYLVPCGVAVVALLYTELWYRRWKLDAE